MEKIKSIERIPPPSRLKPGYGSTWNARELGDNIDHESHVKGMRSKNLAKKSKKT